MSFSRALIFLSLSAVFILPRRMFGDGQLRWDALSDLLDHGILRKDGYSLIGPLFATPLFFLGKLVATPEFWCISYNYLIFVLGLFVLRRLLLKSLSLSIVDSFSLILILGSMFPAHIRLFYGEPFTALMFAIGSLMVFSEGLNWPWSLVVLAVANTPATLAGLGLATAQHAFSQKRLKYFAVPLLTLFLIFAENWLRRGSPLATGYGGNHGAKTLLPYSGLSGFSYPFVLGILSILFSFGKGLVFYVPGLFLPSNTVLKDLPKLKALYRFWIAFTIGLVLVYSKWWAWYGGWFWGPRFFLFACIPASLILAIWIERAKTASEVSFTLCVLTLSFWVGIVGSCFGQDEMGLCTANLDVESFCWYVPEFSSLFRPWVVFRVLRARDWILLVLSAIAYFRLSIPLWKALCQTTKERVLRLNLLEGWKI